MATETAEAAVSAHLTTGDRVGLLRAMLTMRGIEERAMTLYRQGKVPGSFYDGFGQEAVSAGAAWAMAPAGPALHPAPRPRRARHPRRDPRAIFAQYMGREGGITGGRDGNVHFGDWPPRVRRDGLDAARHDARRRRHGDGLQAARRAALRDHVVRRRLDRPRATSTRR
jgi:TPP-dependent pyruvate/acetoin dehydrogenase alpha subunit